jgi:8-oxo-dGTP diphosphatase
MDIHSKFVGYPTGKIEKRDWCDCCYRYNSRRATITTIGVKDGKVVMVYRAKNPERGYWTFPGGYVDWDETVEESAIREFEEESGYEVKKLKLLGVYSDPKRDRDGRQNIDTCFFGEVGEEIGESDDEVERVKWFALNRLPKKIGFDHGKMFEDYMEKYGVLR